MNEKLVIRLDASSLKESHCIRKLYLRTIGGYRGKGLSNSLHYGTCFHHYAEMIAHGKPMHDAITETQCMYQKEELSYSKKTEYQEIGHLTRTLMAYNRAIKEEQIFTKADVLKSPVDGTPLVECKFSLPVYVDDNVEVLLQGTIDRISKIQSGCICIEDFKTTTAKEPDGYFKGHRMSPQFITYVWAVKQLALLHPDGLFAQLLKNNPNVGARILGVFIDPKVDAKFAASDVYFFTDEEMTDYESYLLLTIHDIVNAHLGFVKHKQMPLAEGMFNDTCKSSFGSYCSYFDMCCSYPKNGFDASVAHLDRNLLKRPYTPLNFGGGDKKPAAVTTV